MVNSNRTKRSLFDPKCTKIARRLGEFTSIPHAPSCYRGEREFSILPLTSTFWLRHISAPTCFLFVFMLRLHLYSQNLNICTGQDDLKSCTLVLKDVIRNDLYGTLHYKQFFFQNTAMNVDSSWMIPTGNQIQHSTRNPIAGEMMGRKWKSITVVIKSSRRDRVEMYI